MIEEKFRELIRQYDMLPEGSRVLCACSGGADSVSLLRLLHGLPGVETLCAHFNHCLRGEESDRDEAFVRALCASLGVKCFVGRGDVAAYAAEHGLGTEEAARTLRYAFLEQTAEAEHCNRIATAHNAEDNAETVLMNLARGCGARGLCGIPPVRGKLVRPLLTAGRAEILQYLDAIGQAHVEDSSNAGEDYARNRVRHHILPLLNALNGEAVSHIGTAAALLRQDEDYLSGEAEKFLNTRMGADRSVPVSELLALPKPIGARVLRSLCPGAGEGHIESIFMLCMNRAVHGEADLPGIRVVKERERLFFGPAPARSFYRRELDAGETCIPEAGWRIELRYETAPEEIHNSFNTFYFKSEKIYGRISVAPRKEGDAIRLSGRGCTKTLKKLFSEAEILPWERSRIPVLRDEAGVIAVYGFGVAERCVCLPGETALRIHISELTE